MIIDLKQEVKASQDIHFLQGLLHALVGQRCLKVELSYGGELMLHLGEPQPYAHPKLADETKGAWILGTRASWWRLLLNNPPLLIEEGDLDGELVEKKTGSLSGTSVVAVEPNLLPLHGVGAVRHWGPGTSVPTPQSGVVLVVRFSDGSSLVVTPTGELEQEPPVADWELFTPYHMYLTCGPGPAWSYLRSDVATAANGGE